MTKEPPEPPEAPLLDLIEARARRGEGEGLVLEHQGPEWREHYTGCADRFLATREPGSFFMGEDLRVFALRNGLPQPAHPNAWGAMAGSVLRRWLRGGLVAQDGIDHAQSVGSHAHRYVRYRVTEPHQGVQ